MYINPMKLKPIFQIIHKLNSVKLLLIEAYDLKKRGLFENWL